MIFGILLMLGLSQDVRSLWSCGLLGPYMQQSHGSHTHATLMWEPDLKKLLVLNPPNHRILSKNPK